ncbi:ABC transporter substrate-binding protein [uncultured Cohaesibacter sp.]|uniref:ABC transporter substrate-binding protein n=1 Tax=uncultured Cohaesibacter sp. TaxID=1002546 RepID=UPI002AA639A8|nr:ABC transporter substrate-binding protein [uncultured Cohaesibacter sp.]
MAVSHRITGGACVTALVSSAMLVLAANADAEELIFKPGEGAFNWLSYNDFAATHDYSGTQLTITAAGTGKDGERYANAFKYFAAATGADVRYSGSDSFENDIVISIQAGSPPDLALFPQPGLAKDLAKRGRLSPLGPETRAWIDQNYAAGKSWSNLATYENSDGETGLYGLFYGASVKSIVWYSPEVFEEFGYSVPTSMEDLKALTEQIVADGMTPWCIGLGAGAATGWPATDWVEDMMLRTQTPDIYDKWVANDIPFNDPRVIEAINEYGWFARNDSFVSGGTKASITTDFRDSPNGLFSFPPKCLMHKQSSFVSIFFPKGTEVGTDADFFYFPSYASKDLGQPVLGAGAMVAITKDSEVARGLIEFLKTPIAHEVMMAQGQFQTPFLGANPDLYMNETERKLGKILVDATTFRFDGSDLMPGEIGTSAFWTGMVDYTAGEDAETVATKIQQRWDTIK